jgi:hypothetical protein
LNFLAIGFCILGVREGDVAQLFPHSEFGDVVVGEVVGFLEVIEGSSCDLVEEEELRASAT